MAGGRLERIADGVGVGGGEEARGVGDGGVGDAPSRGSAQPTPSSQVGFGHDGGRRLVA